MKNEGKKGSECSFSYAFWSFQPDQWLPSTALAFPVSLFSFLVSQFQMLLHQQITEKETGLATPDKSSEVNIIIIQQN